MRFASFDHDPRTRLVFGPGSLGRLGVLARELGARRVLLVTDAGIRKAGHVERATRLFAAEGLDLSVFDGVEENPTTHHVEAGVALARGHKADFLVGLGGGSAMDCAKGINFVLTQGGELHEYCGVGKATKPMLPLIAVPTTAGTGSESQSFALISDPVTHLKMACGDGKAAARIAILDPELTLTQPGVVAGSTGIDAVSHAVETLVTRKRTPLSRMFSLEAWRLLEANLESVLRDPKDLEARSGMLLGASLAGAAIENSMLGATHSAANPLTARFGVVHGQAVGILLPHVVRFNAPECELEYRALASTSQLLARRLEALYASTGLPRTLRDFGVEASDLSGLARVAVTQWTAQFNPRTVTESDFLEIYRCAL